MPQLIEIFLPANVDNARQKIKDVEQELVDRYGGVTLHLNAPAKGLWESEGSVESDKIIVVEVMAEELDRKWWGEYRRKLEQAFDQDEVLIRATPVTRL